MTHRLVVFNFEGVIVSNADPYAHFLKKAAQLGIENSCELQKQRLLYPTKNFQAEISQLLENIRSKTGDEIQNFSQQIADETQIRIGIRSVFETLQRDDSVDALIVSDYNNIMLEQTLAAKKIAVGKVDVITNTLRSIAYDEYKPVLSSRNFVICKYCPPNLCRGQQFLWYLREANQRGVSFSKIVLVGSSRSDLCIARYLRQKDYLCAPIGSDLANILTKLTKKERFFKRIMQKAKIRVQATHTCLYSDARSISDILNSHETHNSSSSRSAYVTLSQEKKALLNRVSSQLLPSSKLRHQISTELCDKEVENEWKVSAPFTVIKHHRCSPLSISGEVNGQVVPCDTSLQIDTWSKSIQNIITSLDHFKMDTAAERPFTNDEPKDYFCRRRCPNDMPMGQSKLSLDRKVGDPSNEQLEGRSRLFLPFSRSNTEPIPASEVRTPPATSIWNELYKCQQLPPSNDNSNNGALTHNLNNYMDHLGRVKNEVKFCFDSINTQHLEKQPTKVDEINRECFSVDRKRISLNRRSVSNDCSSSCAHLVRPLNSERGGHHPKDCISKHGVIMSAIDSHTARKRTFTMPANTSNRRPVLSSHVRSSGKIISANLLRSSDNGRNHITTSDVKESAKELLKDNETSCCDSGSQKNHSNDSNNAVIDDSKNKMCSDDNLTGFKEESIANIALRNQSPYDYVNVSMNCSRNKIDKIIEIGNNEDEEMIYVRQIESPDDIGDNNNNNSNNNLASVIYEQFNFAPVTQDNYPTKQKIIRNNANTYGIINLVSGRVYSSQEVIPSLCDDTI